MLRKRRKAEEDEEIASQLVSLSGDYTKRQFPLLISGETRSSLKYISPGGSVVLTSELYPVGSSLPNLSLSKSKSVLPAFSESGRKKSLLERAKGATLQASLTVSFQESVTGTKRRIRISRRELCKECNPLATNKKQPQAYNQSSQTQQTSSPNSCRLCTNTGTCITPVEVEVAVPAGVMNGWKKVLEGQGDVSAFGLRGDLIVIFKVESHPFFVRKCASDVSCDLPISFIQAALGETFEIPSIDGSRVQVVVPPGTQPFHIITLKGYGFVDFRHPARRGDMYVKILVQIPTSLTEEERKLLERLEELSESNDQTQSS